MAEDFGLSFKPMKLPRQKRRRKQEQPQEIDPTILQSLGGGVLGLAGAAGNALSLPGSSVVDVLAGKNPFDQWVTPFSDANRTSGRDLLRQYGMAGKKDTWGNFAAGLAVDIGTDPTTLLGLSPLGKTAKGLGMLKSGQKLTKGVGAGIRAGERALASGKIPFGPQWQRGTGETAAKIGDVIDAGWEAARSTVPGRMIAAGFNRGSRGMKTRLMQQAAEEYAHPAAQQGKRNAKRQELDTTFQLKEAGITDPNAMWRGLEGITDEVPDNIRQPVNEMMENIRLTNRMWRGKGKPLQDKYIRNFAHRQVSAKRPTSEARSNRAMAGTSGRDSARDPLLKDWMEGTAGVRKFFMDDTMRGIVESSDQAAKGITNPKEINKLRKKTLRQLETHIQDIYGDSFFPTVKVKKSLLPKLPEGFEALDDDGIIENMVAKYHYDLRRQVKPGKPLKGATGLTKRGNQAYDPPVDLGAKYKSLFKNYLMSSSVDKSKITPEIVDSLWDRFSKSQKDRIPSLARRFYGSSKETMDTGLYGNIPTVDIYNYMAHSAEKKGNIEAINFALNKVLPDRFKGLPGSAPVKYTESEMDEWAKIPLKGVKTRSPEQGKTVWRVFKDLGVEPQVWAGVFLRENGLDVTAERMQDLVQQVIPKDIADDMTRLAERRTGTTAENWARKYVKQYMNMFKAGVLAHPARHVRDFFGGTINNIIHGIATPLDSLRADKVIKGKSIKGMQGNPYIQQWVASQGLPMNDETATQALRFIFAENIPGDVAKHSDVAGSTFQASQGMDAVLDAVPGIEPTTTLDSVKQVARTFAGKDGATWDPRKATVRGVNEADKNTFAPFATSDKIGTYTDRLNRLGPFIKMMREGWEPGAAMDRINSVQVNYDPDTFTKTEQALKELFPFYSYTSRMTKHVAKELVTNPGGGLANTIRLQNAARDRSGTTPDHIADTAAIPDPFYKSTDGTKQYLTGLGLMHEDALQFMQPSASAVTGEVLSRLNPLAQKAIELGTGRSLFFKEPGGGRPIEDLDPTIGRILANVTGSQDAVRYPGDWVVENVNSMLPTSRLTTTARQLTDPRKSLGGKLLNTFTGMKVTTVSPQQQERTLRRKLEEVARSLGGRTFEQIYFPESKTYTGEAKERVEAYKTVINALSKRAKERAKDKLKK